MVNSRNHSIPSGPRTTVRRGGATRYVSRPASNPPSPKTNAAIGARIAELSGQEYYDPNSPTNNAGVERKIKELRKYISELESLIRSHETIPESGGVVFTWRKTLEQARNQLAELEGGQNGLCKRIWNGAKYILTCGSHRAQRTRKARKGKSRKQRQSRKHH